MSILIASLGLFFFLAWNAVAAPLLRDAREQVFDLADRPQRVVSAFVGADEILLALLEDEPQRILALSPLARDKRYSSVAQLAQRWPVFGEEIESLIQMKPELVIAARYTRAEWIETLKRAKIKTFLLGQFSSIEDVLKNIETIGRLLHKEEKAAQLIDRFRKRSAELRASCPLRGKKLLHYTEDAQLFGHDTTFDSLVNALGAENLIATLGVKGWAKVSDEKILMLRPDFLIAAGVEQDRKSLLQRLRANLPWKHLKAVEEGKLILIPPPALSSVSQHILAAMEAACAAAARK